MLPQRRIGRTNQRSSILSLRNASKASGRRHGRDLAALREANRRRLQVKLQAADLIDDDFDDLGYSPEVLLQLANQI
ncbi:hypothetical protein [Bosea sp. UC22_33]|uniref:hypothetical protein n=1 Tax=Bosea sp. UC22_33 TaxID=3350165 RepID=UPI003672082B